jgi:hypothetical protein
VGGVALFFILPYICFLLQLMDWVDLVVEGLCGVALFHHPSNPFLPAPADSLVGPGG